MTLGATLGSGPLTGRLSGGVGAGLSSDLAAHLAAHGIEGRNDRFAGAQVVPVSVGWQGRGRGGWVQLHAIDTYRS